MTFFLQAALQSAVISSLLVLVLVTLRRRSAATRHCVSVVAFASMLALPLFTIVLPHWKVLPSEPSRVVDDESSRPRNPGDVTRPPVESHRLVDRNSSARDNEAPRSEHIADATATTSIPPDSGAPAYQPDSAAKSTVEPAYLDWLAFGVLLWLTGVVLILGRLLTSFLRLRHRAKTTRVLESGREVEVLESIRQRMGIRFPIRLLMSDSQSMPMTWGFRSRYILLPQDASGWDRPYLDSVIAHELEHVRRRDCWTNLLIQIGCAMYWLNPLVWFCARRAFADSERACDDGVLQFGVKPSAYAGHVLRVVSEHVPRRLPQGAMGMARTSSIERRIVAILDENQPRMSITRARTAVIVGLAMLMFLPFAVLRAADPANPDEQPDRSARKPEAPRIDKYGDPLPNGVLRRLGTTRLRQRQGVVGVTFSPDGKLLASYGWGDSIRLWDTKTGKPTRRIHGTVRNGTFGVAISRDGKLLASVGEDGLVRLFQTATGKELLKKRAHNRARTYGVAFSHDGRQFVSACGAGDIRIWDVATRKVVRLLENRGRRGVTDRHDVAFSHNGRMLASANGSTLRVWNFKTKKKVVLHVERKQPWQLMNVAFSTDDKKLYSYREHHAKGLQAWELATGRLLPTAQRGGVQLGASGMCAALSKDRSILATSNQDKLRVWDVKTARVIHTFSDYRNQSGMRNFGLAISPDRTLLAARNGGSTVRVWNLKTGKPMWRDPKLHTTAVTASAYSSDGKTLATGDFRGSICLWNPASGRLHRTLEFGDGAVRFVAFAPNGKTLYAGGTGSDKQGFFGRLKSFDVATGKLLKQRRFAGRVTAGVVSPDGSQLACASGGIGSPEQPPKVLIHVLNLKTWTDAVVLRGHRRAVRRMAFSVDRKSLVSISDGGVAIRWNLINGKPERTMDPKLKRVHVIALSRFGDTAICARMRGATSEESEGEMFHFNLATGKTRVLNVSSTQWGWAIGLSRDGKRVATFQRALWRSERAFDDDLVIWDASSGKELLRRRVLDGQVKSLLFSPDGKTLASGMERGDTLVWDLSEVRR